MSSGQRNPANVVPSERLAPQLRCASSLGVNGRDAPMVGMGSGSTSSAELDAEAEVDEREVMYILVHALLHGPLPHIGEQLAREAAERNLLPVRYDFQGEVWEDRAVEKG